MARELAGWWRRLPAISRVGWVLYLCSMITPARDLAMVGAGLFLRLPAGLVTFFGSHPSNPLPGICACIGLAANLLVLVPVPWGLSLVAVLAPWLALLWLNAGSPAQVQGTVSGWLFYYPWAVGIVLISVGRGATDRARPPSGVEPPARV
jgi:hypothetical protein